MASDRLEIRIVADNRQALNAMSDVSRAMGTLAQKVEAAKTNFRTLAAAVAVGQGALAGFVSTMRAITISMPRAAISAAVEFESLETAMRAVFGSADAVRREMDSLRAMSERLGLPLQTLSRQWSAFAAATHGAELTGEHVKEVFTAISVASTVLGMSSMQLEGSLYAVQQMISKNAVTSEELRRQLGDRLYGAVQIASRSIGLTSDAFNDLLERGMIPVEKFLPALARQIMQELGQYVPEAANTARAAFARLENALLDLKLEFARSGFIDAIVDAARQITSAFKDDGFRQSVREFGALIGSLTRFVVEHAKELAVLGGVLAGARTGAAAGRLLGPQGSLIGAGVGAVSGGVGAASILPEGTASGQDERRVMDVEAAVARLKRRIEETRWSAAAGLIKQDEAARRIAEDQAKIARLTAKPSTSAPEGQAATLGPALQWQALADKYRSANDKLAQEIARAREIGKALGKPQAEIEAMVAKIRAGDKVGRPRIMPEAFDAELAALKAGLKNAEDLLEASFRARLVKEQDYWQAKGAMMRQAIDLEQREIEGRIKEQERLLKTTGIDAAQAQAARNKLAELKVALDALAGRRAVVEVEVKANLDRAAAEIAALKDKLRLEIAQATGTETPQQRAAAIRAEFADLLTQMAGDAEGIDLINRAIDVRIARDNLQALETRWRDTLERMRQAHDNANVLRDAGVLTQSQAEARITQAAADAKTAMEALLPAMQRAMEALYPPEEVARRMENLRAEILKTKPVVENLGTKIAGQVQDAFAAMFESIGSGAKTAKEAFLDFARSVLAAINKIASQKLAEALFGGKSGGFDLGGFISAGLKRLGFASGGYVTGPGTSTSDSIPARLSAGEYVVRAEAVRRVGVAFLDAINGLNLPPAWSAGRLAFAAGGMVPQVQQPAPQQSVRIVNVVDPALARDYLDSPQGERVLLNVLSRNAGAVKQILMGA